MINKKFNGIETQLASSILYYDQEELDEFFIFYEQLIQNCFIVVDGTFDAFIKYFKKFNNFDDNPEIRKNNIVSYLILKNGQNPDKNLRDTFSLWLDNVLKLQVDMELAEDVLHHFLWDHYKKSIDLADKSKIPFNEKLCIKPPQLINSSIDKIINLEDIIPKEEVDKTKYTTGLEELDKIVSLTQTNFCVLAARPGVGKSLLMLQSAIANARNGVKTLFLSLEMGENQIDSRIVNHFIGDHLENRYKDEYGNTNYKEYKDAYLEAKKQRSFKPIKQNLQLYVTKGSSADSILDRLEKQITENLYEAVFIDYLQLLRYNNIDEWASLRKLTNSLKNLAFRLNVLIITGSQVLRSSTERGLYLSDLFGSSSIEADADVVIGLENPRERRQGEKAVINIKVMKNREGDLAEIGCTVDYSIGKIIGMI